MGNYLADVCDDWVKQEPHEKQPKWILAQEPPSSYPTSFNVRFFVPSTWAQTQKLMRVEAKTPVSEVMAALIMKFRKTNQETQDPSAYLFSCTGMLDILWDDQPIIMYQCVRSALKKNKEVSLTLVEVSEIPSTEFLVSAHRQNLPSVTAVPWESITAQELYGSGADWLDQPYIPFWELDFPFRVVVGGLEGLKDDFFSFWRVKEESSDSKDHHHKEKDKVVKEKAEWLQALGEDRIQLQLKAELYCGGSRMAPPLITSPVNYSPSPRWNEMLSFDLSTQSLPQSARICFSLLATQLNSKDAMPDKEKEKEKSSRQWPLACVNCLLIDHTGRLREGWVDLALWPNDSANPIGTCEDNRSDPSAAYLFVGFDTYRVPVIFPSTELLAAATSQAAANFASGSAVPPSGEAALSLQRLQRTDPLYVLTDSDIDLIWTFREYCKEECGMLAKFLKAVPWSDPWAVREAYRLLPEWQRPSPLQALELLDAKFPDVKVRGYAVSCLESLSDDQLVDFLLQLSQALKYENYHDSELARFLLRRSIQNPRKVGHVFFWHLRAEMHVPEIAGRYGVMLDAYLQRCVGHRAELCTQNSILGALTQAANAIKAVKGQDKRMKVLQKELKAIKFPPRFALPLDSRQLCSGLRIEKCKFMDSKKLPLWLVFENADPNGDPIYVIYKVGDDLRQDALTLQMIRIMDNLWQADGLDCLMSPYGCVATGDEIGMLEVVMNAETTSSIQKAAGGAKAAFAEDPIANWLREQNPTDKGYEKAVENFTYSCAGYCVATYVLGIGDRHNDNIMVTKSGNLFHIDFGHFLGNFKKKFGIRRERAPFVLTPDFAFVMGGRDSEQFKKFVAISCQAFNILRRHSDLFLNLFAMMLSTGIPELRSPKDIEWMQRAFCGGCSDEEAAEEFTKLIYESLDTKATQINNYIHNLAH